MSIQKDSQSKSGRPGAKNLRVGIILNGKVIEERVVDNEESISVGYDSACTFVVNDNDAPKKWELFERVAGSYVLRFEESTKGKLTFEEKKSTLAEAQKFEKVKKSGTVFALPLNDESRGRIQLSENLTVMFHFVDAKAVPPATVLPASASGGWLKSLEPFFMAALAFSFVVHSVMSIVVFVVEPPPPPSAEDARKWMARLAETEVVIEEPVEEDTLDEDEEDEGEGKDNDKPAKPSKKADTKKAAPSKDTGAAKPSGKAGPTASERSAVQNQVQASSAMLALIGAKGGAGDSAIGDIFSDNNALGDVSASLDGTVGVGIAGSGAEVTRRTAGAGNGTGGGGGSGANIDLKGGSGGGKGPAVKKKKKAAPKAAMKTGKARIDGTIDAKSVKRTLRQRAKAFQACYEKALKTNSKLKGKVKVVFVINERGRVSSVDIVKDSVGSSQVSSCLKSAFKRLRFPKPDDGDVEISYSIVFQPG